MLFPLSHLTVFIAFVLPVSVASGSCYLDQLTGARWANGSFTSLDGGVVM